MTIILNVPSHGGSKFIVPFQELHSEGSKLKESFRAGWKSTKNDIITKLGVEESEVCVTVRLKLQGVFCKL